MKQNPQIGQRWLVDTDAALGLGLVVAVEGRRLTLEFPATGESRQYAIKNAPLTRAVFAEGDTIETSDGQQHRVAKVESINDLLIYLNEAGDPIPETQLSASIQLNHPLKRLLAAQLDKPAWFDVRQQLSRGYQQWLRSGLQGLVGARITLSPHQLYVAHSASARESVRILLADEVGMGKTIEAGLILQRLQRQNRVSRALVVVPESLCVQWFVELLRCFSIAATLVDEETDMGDSRVFIAAHAALSDPRFLEADPWDMVIVDEAHHFDLTDAETALNQSLKNVSQHCEHMLLLTATPERLGLESHFLRLQLLDPNRFHHFNEFERAYENYQTLANDLAHLLADNDDDLPVTQAQVDQLNAHFNLSIDLGLSKSALLELLLDSLGTGRMVYRNTRHGVSGFPARQLVKHKLDDEAGKLAWLKDFVRQHLNEKCLLITHHKQHVIELKEWLYQNTGIDCPVFHEDMTLIERDRAAAYFADAEEGAPLLLCSEIGSEGRNFQFCHKLICWDLPEHPDVLEQRIGRLDRIGQSQDIEIHVCIDSPDSEKRLHWFHSVLASIEQINPAAGVVHDTYFDEYWQQPEHVEPKAKAKLASLLQELEQGRDRLLEINSCRHPQAEQLVERIKHYEVEHNPKALLENMTDVLNLHYEQLDDYRYRLIPSDQMLVPMIPGIPLEGCEITFDRASAVAREDIEFVTWDHPLMQGLAEMIDISDLGVASVGLLPNKSLKPGMLFAEALFGFTIQSEHAKELQHYLTESAVRVVVTDKNPNNLSAALSSAQLSQLVETASKAICKTVVSDYRPLISQLIEQAETLAVAEAKAIITDSVKHCEERGRLEQARLRHLQKSNRTIKDADIQAVVTHYADIANGLLTQCKTHVKALRLLITYKPEH